MENRAVQWLLLVLVTVAPARAGELPLSLVFCLDSAMGANRDLVQARQEVQALEGERIFVRARFMPSLDLVADYAADRAALDSQVQDRLSSQLRFNQRLFEFGPDAVQEVTLRDNLRRAVYAYEGEVYQVLAQVWERFHLILLQDRQIAIRRESRRGFEEIFARQQALKTEKLATEDDVLSAELNVLREDQRINVLIREQFDNKMDLQRLIGQSIGVDIQLQGTVETVEQFALDQEEAVQLALGSSVQVALASERLDEQQRVVREQAWTYSPDINLHAGVENNRRRAQVKIDKEASAWGADLSSDLRLDDGAEPLAEGTRWFTRLEARIPLFEGGARIGQEARERARLRQRRVGLEDLRHRIDLQVRQAHLLMEEALRQKEIQERAVVIARRRLQINQKLKERGLVSDIFFEQQRDRFFDEQDQLFANQANYISQQAKLRLLMGFFE